MNGAFQSFTDLELWKKVRRLKNELKVLAETFPNEEKFRLTDQIIRSARSINSCIAEGHGRFTFKDQLHFYIMARGSLSETLNHLIDAFDCNYIKAETLINYKEKLDDAGKFINGYISYLKKQILKEK